MIIITKTVGIIAIIYGFVMAYGFLKEHMSLTQTQMLFNHWQDILPILCVFFFGAILFELE